MNEESDLFELAEFENMKCDQVTELLYLYVCEELNDADSRRMSSHLMQCASCRKALAETVRIAGVLGSTLPRIPQTFFAADH
jgi:anti-sigma factor RsiW